MKNTKYKSILLIVIIAILTWNCSDDDKLPIDFNDLELSGGAFASETNSTGNISLEITNPLKTNFTKTYTLMTPAPSLGSDVKSVSFYLTLKRAGSKFDEVLYKIVNNSNSSTSPKIEINFVGEDLLSSLKIAPADLIKGDEINVRLALTTPNGVFSSVSSNFDNQSADHTFTIPVN